MATVANMKTADAKEKTACETENTVSDEEETACETENIASERQKTVRY